VGSPDYDGDFIQHQGDRIQGLFYSAKSSGRYASKAMEAAAALQDAFTICREVLPGFAKLSWPVVPPPGASSSRRWASRETGSCW
jgi:hypothetical protein